MPDTIQQKNMSQKTKEETQQNWVAANHCMVGLAGSFVESAVEGFQLMNQVFS